MTKTLTLTGACGALGHAICKKALSEGLKINALCRTIKTPLKEVNYFECDFSKKESIKDIPPSFFETDILINNISMRPNLGITHKRPLSDFEDQINTGLYSSINLTQNCIKFLLKRKGIIINILSSYTLSDIPKGCSPYVVQKFALLGYGRSLQEEYSGRNLSVYNLSPHVMDTPFLTDLPESIREQLKKSESTTTPQSVVSKIFNLIKNKPPLEHNTLI